MFVTASHEYLQSLYLARLLINSHNIYTCADMIRGCVGDMVELGVTESFQVKRQVLISASEAAEMILRVDDIIKAAPR